MKITAPVPKISVTLELSLDELIILRHIAGFDTSIPNMIFPTQPEKRQPYSDLLRALFDGLPTI